ncbi:hypothetical protein [Alteribacillus bidgolensis]|uniref:Uncharacterized protein n=1 Tax=Alteribacillus bidgolensis TaxID=930129 RepID=A0A1G8H144_9BACI|nr:hypothetical protein [Alteribacillus bidgolensis]SDI00365.1 hypothetical protein SAMN05216352_10460 [Alteribacillus bidgolensis]
MYYKVCGARPGSSAGARVAQKQWKAEYKREKVFKKVGRGAQIKEEGDQKEGKLQQSVTKCVGPDSKTEYTENGKFYITKMIKIVRQSKEKVVHILA